MSKKRLTFKDERLFITEGKEEEKNLQQKKHREDENKNHDNYNDDNHVKND